MDMVTQSLIMNSLMATRKPNKSPNGNDPNKWFLGGVIFILAVIGVLILFKK